MLYPKTYEFDRCYPSLFAPAPCPHTIPFIGVTVPTAASVFTFESVDYKVVSLGDLLPPRGVPATTRVTFAPVRSAPSTGSARHCSTTPHAPPPLRAGCVRTVLLLLVAARGRRPAAPATLRRHNRSQRLRRRPGRCVTSRHSTSATNPWRS